jgi:hypothetical protein
MQSAQVASPQAGDAVTIRGTDYELISEPMADGRGLSWICEARPS